MVDYRKRLWEREQTRKWERGGSWGKRKDGSLSFYQASSVEEEGRASKRGEEGTKEKGEECWRSETLRKVQTAGEAFNLSPGTPRYLCDSILEASSTVRRWRKVNP